jgi:hypothetical protein
MAERRGEVEHFTDEELAYHEAGHAVIHHLTGGTISRVSIDRGDRGRGTQLADEPPPADFRQRVAVLMAGEAALERRGVERSKVPASGASDREAARRLAGGAGLDAGAAGAAIDEALAGVRARLAEAPVWRQVEAVAVALLERRTLDGPQFAPLPADVGNLARS